MKGVCGALSVLLLWSAASSLAEAGGCRPRARARANFVVQLDTGLTIVPFAAATQVLVIREPAFFYAYSAYAALPPPAAAAEPPEGVEQTGLVARTCGACHAGAAPAGGFDVSDFARLTAADRLHAVSRIVSDDDALRMPRGRTLSPAEIGALVQEFTQQAAMETPTNVTEP